VLAAMVALAGCATPSYSACPVELAGDVPPGAFAVCRDLLALRFGALAVADEDAFLLQTIWAPTTEPPGERRATVFRQRVDGRYDLSVVVELRRLTKPLFGLPSWTGPRGDAAAERELAALLRAAIAAAGPPPAPGAGAPRAANAGQSG
jgi:hypothetical protein